MHYINYICTYVVLYRKIAFFRDHVLIAASGGSIHIVGEVMQVIKL